MSNTTKNQFLKKNRIASRYRWEFLRRNKTYAKERTRLLIEAKQKERAMRGATADEYSNLLEWRIMAWKEFTERWGLADMGPGSYIPNPRLWFYRLSKGEKRMLMPYATNPSWISIEFMADKLARGGMDTNGFSKIGIKINFDMSKERIIHEMKRLVQYMKDYRIKCGFIVTKPSYKSYDWWLKIYDIKQKRKKITYKDLYRVASGRAKAFKVGKDDESSVTKAYKSAEECVASGYRNIW